jgi:hypothetical protein
VCNHLDRAVQPKGSGFSQEKSPWRTRESGRTTLPKKGWTDSKKATPRTGKKLIDKTKQIDPKAVEELAEEVQRDKEDVERFVNKS